MTSTASADLKPLAITMGDAAGIGPEIIAKAYRDDAAALQGCFVVGDVDKLPIERKRLYDWSRKSQVMIKTL